MKDTISRMFTQPAFKIEELLSALLCLLSAASLPAGADPSSSSSVLPSRAPLLRRPSAKTLNTASGRTALQPIRLASKASSTGREIAEAGKASRYQVQNARFTVITPNLIRMEYDPSGKFVDQPSIFAADRGLSAPAIVDTQQGVTTISTPALKLTYIPDGRPFSPTNLSVTVATGGQTVRWVPGLNDPANLGGTICTLDGVSNPVDLKEGLLSRSGWALIDDSTSPLLTADGWVEARPQAQKSGRDWYFFGYGNNYRAALSSLTSLSGSVPLPRRYALGIWYSRYWPWSEEDYKSIVSRYGTEDFPLDNVVLDMDWHKDGWTGWSWNTKLLPDAPGLLKWLHSQDLHCTLNLHPADGVAPHEDRYGDFMKALNQDPSGKKTLPFDAGSKSYMEAFFNTVITPLKKDGVDFWWLDWQQFPQTHSLADLTNLFWLNRLFYNYTAEPGQRGLSFSRWGGFGDQRNPIHFSGDAGTSFPTLAFEVPFTSTAGNVGCFFWSHDIGGHMGGRNEESYARWCQFGATSAALRSHSTRDASMDRVPWNYAKWAEDSMRISFHLRSELFPYIYTASAQSCRQSVPLNRPIYLDLPEREEAYHNGQEFLLGDNILVAPVATAGAGPGRVSCQTVWLPPTDSGFWYNLLTGERAASSSNIVAAATIDEFPIFVRGGVPIPMQPYTARMGVNQVEMLRVRCYPGREGQQGKSNLYEDDGVSTGYKNGESATTSMEYEYSGSTATISIGKAEGHFKGQPEKRGYFIELADVERPERVTVNGQGGSFSYDSDKYLVTIPVQSLSPREPVKVVVEGYKPSGWAQLHNRAAITRLKNTVDDAAGLADIKPAEAESNLPIAALSAALSNAASQEQKAAALAVAGIALVHKNVATYFYPEAYQEWLFVPPGLIDGNKITTNNGLIISVPEEGLAGMALSSPPGQDLTLNFSVAGKAVQLKGTNSAPDKTAQTKP